MNGSIDEDAIKLVAQIISKYTKRMKKLDKKLSWQRAARERAKSSKLAATIADKTVKSLALQEEMVLQEKKALQTKKSVEAMKNHDGLVGWNLQAPETRLLCSNS